MYVPLPACKKFGSRNFWTPAKTNVPPRKARRIRIDHGIASQEAASVGVVGRGAARRRPASGRTGIGGALFVFMLEMFVAARWPAVGRRFENGKNRGRGADAPDTMTACASC